MSATDDTTAADRPRRLLDTPQDAAFRSRLREWLEANNTAIERHDWDARREWQAKLYTRIFNLMYELQTIQRPSASLLIGARAR